MYSRGRGRGQAGTREPTYPYPSFPNTEAPAYRIDVLIRYSVIDNDIFLPPVRERVFNENAMNLAGASLNLCERYEAFFRQNFGEGENTLFVSREHVMSS